MMKSSIRYAIVDDDELLPHNIARHALHSAYVGHPKTTGLVHYLDQLYDTGAKGIVANVLKPAEQTELLASAFERAEVILDVSASVTVARYIALDVASSARRVSVFLNPTGTDVVVFAEDTRRTLKLDDLESQYYRAVNTSLQLQGHLETNDGRLRYGRSCRDISTSMSTYLVSSLASLASEAIRRALRTPDASIKILRSNRDTLAVVSCDVPVNRVFKEHIGDWTLILDAELLEKLHGLRSAKLPNETGGVLLGVYDLDRKTIYIVDTISSPPDSEEWPTLYIRGSEGLLEQVQSVAKRTGSQLEYVGEWHSHPDNCATRPSPDDLQVFAWLTEHMATAGLPALMAIVGEQSSSSWYIGQMLETGGWEVKKEG
jgi:proteasome lid subunit RPN8/RPN11